MLNWRTFIFALAALIASGGAPAQVKIRLAHELPLAHYGQLYIDRWAKLVKERSKGAVSYTHLTLPTNREV